MHRLRTRKSLVLFSIGVAAVAAFLPLVSSGFAVVLTPLWLVLPCLLVTFVRRTAARCDEQTESLRSLLPSRAPPSAAVVV